MVLASAARKGAPQRPWVPENFLQNQVEQEPRRLRTGAAGRRVARSLRWLIEPILRIAAGVSSASVGKATGRNPLGAAMDPASPRTRRCRMDGMVFPTGAFLGIERSVCGKRWRVRAAESCDGIVIAQHLGLPEILGRLLAQRGIGVAE